MTELPTKNPIIPNVRSVDHVAYTVPNLDKAVNFFVDHFGGECIFYDGPFSDDRGAMARRLNVHPQAVSRLAMIRLGKHTNIELFEYSSPDQSGTGPKNSDIGGHHLALYVDDIDEGYEYIKNIPGVSVLEGPNDVSENSPVAGQRWFYFLTPWGMQMELTSCPGGRFYAGLAGERMAPPGDAWR